ncbi:hypothetical protein [Paenibacillus tengchongensis]|uniref:hypothetical protein n=1 Tax=Paenibacillus tengchongensis TaxID=2608684 RepID=UPI00124EFE04|nr:hypothetical protein [Paenibacillus tengchongensis]
MNKITPFILSLTLALLVLSGCGNSGNNADNGAGNGSAAATEAPDAVTTASVVDNNEAFKQAISKEGTWIAATLNDLTFTEDLVVEGEFINKEKPARKIALYTQDAEHNITASFRLTAPKMTIRSENTQLQGGIFAGDIYVEADGFTVMNATVQGNVYFANEQYQSTFNSADQGIVTGVTEVRK